MQTRDQRYAAKIFRQVSDDVAPSEKDAYGSMAHKLPVLIRTAGLTQALEFVEARGKPAHKKLLEHLAGAVLGDGQGRQVLRERSRTTTQLSEYMRLTHEALAALLWYKRFAQSVLGVDASQAKDFDQEEAEPAAVDDQGEGGEG